MSVLAELRAEPTGSSDPLGQLLDDLAHTHQASLLMEGTDGRLIGHSLSGPAAAPVVAAVLGRTSQPLHRARGSARTAALLGDGPVLTTSLQGYEGTVTVYPVAGGGWLWALQQHAATLDPSALARLSGLLARLRGHATDELLYEQLHDERAMGGVLTDTWVAVVSTLGARVAPTELHAQLRRALPPTARAQVTVSGQTGYVVLRNVSAEDAAVLVVERALSSTSATTAAVVASAAGGLAAARSHAERGLAVRAVAQTCLRLRDCRPYELLARLQPEFVTDLVGTDPLAELLGADPVLARTLHAWLSALGDTPCAASACGVHPNTFRYRLTKAKSLVLADLDDPVARLEVQLRLHVLLEPSDTRR